MNLGARLARLEALEVDTALTEYARVLATVVRGASHDELRLTVAAQDAYERGETPTPEQEAVHAKLHALAAERGADAAFARAAALVGEVETFHRAELALQRACPEYYPRGLPEWAG